MKIKTAGLFIVAAVPFAAKVAAAHLVEKKVAIDGGRAVTPKAPLQQTSTLRISINEIIITVPIATYRNPLGREYIFFLFIFQHLKEYFFYFFFIIKFFVFFIKIVHNFFEYLILHFKIQEFII